MQRLEKLVLEGNLCTSMPYYREYIIGMCRNIISIDGVKVTPLERENARSLAKKAHTFYEQLRLNELRNCILLNMRNHLACLRELLHVVFGKFRSLRGYHLPTKGESFLEGYGEGATGLDNTTNPSVGMIIQVATAGGVFRWMQIAAVDDFDKSVQV
jgi:hypothetical protein